MKKLFAVAAAVALLGVIGCGNKNNDMETQGNGKPNVSSEVQSQEAGSQNESGQNESGQNESSSSIMGSSGVTDSGASNSAVTEFRDLLGGVGTMVGEGANDVVNGVDKMASDLTTWAQGTSLTEEEIKTETRNWYQSLDDETKKSVTDRFKSIDEYHKKNAAESEPLNPIEWIMTTIDGVR